ncbi:MAG: ATP-binding cassette domain-containing protein [Anaerococcus sp.]|nr:ATP-binding cassette domain-containing protein [Anaerococcus sp.]
MIEVNNIAKSINGVSILEDISLKLLEGRVYGFQGRNGSGKTMLFRAITGLIGIDKGEVIVNDLKLDNKYFAKDVGLLLENPSFLPNLSGYKNLSMIAAIRNIIDKDRIYEILKLVGLYEARDKEFGKYSLGMKQRLAIGQAIMEYPKILMLDEPTNAIDEEGIEVLKKIIKEEKNKGTIVLLASHEKEIIEECADQVFMMKNGKIIDRKILNNKE